MTSYRFLAADAMSRVVREEIPFDNVKFTMSLNGAGTFSASLPINHPKAVRSTLDPARTIVYVERDGVILGGWWLWTAKMNGASVQFDGAELWSYWRRRYLRSTQTFANSDTADIAVWILAVASGESGSWMSSYSEYDPTGVKIAATYYGYERKVIASIVEDLAKTSVTAGGFDFGYVSSWDGDAIADTFHIWRRRGRLLDLVFEDGVTAEDVACTIDGASCANRVEVTGSGQQDAMAVWTEQDKAMLTSYPLLEYVESMSDTNNLFYLAFRAISVLAARKEPPETQDVTAGKHPSVALGTYGVGDTIIVRANHGYMGCDGEHRVTAIEVAIGPDGSEIVKPSFATEASFG